MERKRNTINVLANDYEKYTGGAIYALIGSDGKRYIGQSINYYQRMQQHRYAFNSIAKGKKDAPEGNKLIDAITNGITFHAEILEKIPFSECTINNLNRKENYYFDLYGGLNGTYNSTAPKSPYYLSEFGDVIRFGFNVYDTEIIRKLDSVGDYNTYLKELIRKDIRKHEQTN